MGQCGGHVDRSTSPALVSSAPACPIQHVMAPLHSTPPPKRCLPFFDHIKIARMNNEGLVEQHIESVATGGKSNILGFETSL